MDSWIEGWEDGRPPERARRRLPALSPWDAPDWPDAPTEEVTFRDQPAERAVADFLAPVVDEP